MCVCSRCGHTCSESDVGSQEKNAREENEKLQVSQV